MNNAEQPSKTPGIVTIPLYCPAKYGSMEKIEAFFPPSLTESACMPVTGKRFPRNDIVQLRVKPWFGKEYEYCICLKAKDHIPLGFRDIHDHCCLIQFFRQNDEVKANLYVKMT